MGVGHKLYVKIGDNFEPISGILAGENLKPLIKVKLDTAIKKYIKTCTSQKCVKNQNNEQFDFNRMMIFATYVCNKIKQCGSERISHSIFIRTQGHSNYVALCQSGKESTYFISE